MPLLSNLSHRFNAVYYGWHRFLLHQTGRKWVHKQIRICIGVCVAYKAFTHSFFKTRMMQYNSLMGEDNDRLEIPDHLYDVMDYEYISSEVQLPDYAKHTRIRMSQQGTEVDFFMTNSPMGMSLGYTYGVFGAAIGIPLRLALTSPDQVVDYLKRISISSGGITKNSMSIPMDHPKINDLIQTILLSENAQRFWVMQKLNLVRSSMSVHTEVGCFGFSMAAAAGGSWLMNDMFGLLKYHRSIRLVVYGALWYAAYAFYMEIRDQTNALFNLNADQKTSYYGLQYIDGGIEELTKQLEYNKILREILGPTGERYYTAEGDYTNSRRLFFKCPPSIKQRLHYLYEHRRAFLQDPEHYGTQVPDYWGNKKIRNL